ncbi:hypothetical protein L2E82_15646 [Cichorium intybus]|uniref:Uncharacterized protein n=1 Tax=Cichorium intybus TaxID=13427 RepID=A0ACB9F2P4_CICIN|nr:hypothetical protein L2E82_15646 [Cichorium intybus]
MSCPKLGVSTTFDQSGLIPSPEVVEQLLKRFINAGMLVLQMCSSKDEMFSSNSARSHQPSDGISKVVFRGQVTNEEVESLNKSGQRVVVQEKSKEQDLPIENVVTVQTVLHRLAVFVGVLVFSIRRSSLLPRELRSVTRTLVIRNSVNFAQGNDAPNQPGEELGLTFLASAKPLLTFVDSNFLPLALITGVILGLINPTLGCFADGYRVATFSPFGIFFLSITLRSEEVSTAVEAWPVGLFSHLAGGNSALPLAMRKFSIASCIDYTVSNGSLLESFGTLCKRLRLLSDVPLVISSVQPLDSAFRHTSVFPPRPHLLLNGTKVGNKMLSTCTPSLELEGLGNWPMDDVAIERTKSAFLSRIGECLQKAYGMNYCPSEEGVDVFFVWVRFSVEDFA